MVIPDEGKERFLAYCFGATSLVAGTCTVFLYVNDYTPVDGSTSSNFTPPSFGGGGGITINPADWNAVTVVGSVAEVETASPPSWTMTSGSPETIYGWYLQDSGSGKIMAAQRFDAPHLMDIGATETLSPFKVKLKTFA